MAMRRVPGASVLGRKPGRPPMLVAETHRLELVPAGPSRWVLRMAGRRNRLKLLDMLRWDSEHGGYRWTRLKRNDLQDAPQTGEALFRMGFGPTAIRDFLLGRTPANTRLEGGRVRAGIGHWPGNVPEVAVELDGETTPIAWLLIDRERRGSPDYMVWQFTELGEAWLLGFVKRTYRPADPAGLAELRDEIGGMGFSRELADTAFAGRSERV